MTSVVAQFGHDSDYSLADAEQFASKIGYAFRRERCVRPECFRRSQRLVEDFQRSFQRSNREAGLGVPTSRYAAERAGKFSAQHHAMTDEIAETEVVFLRVSSVPHFVQEGM